MKHLEFAQVLEGCRRHDAHCQKRLYRHFYNYGMTVCSRYASHREEAKEILNDAFYKVFTKLDHCRDEPSFKGWLNRVLVNTAIDHYRKQKHRTPTVDLVHAAHLRVDESPLESLSAQELLALVQQLPPSYRLVFNLHVVEGYSHTEIAERLGISKGTSKSNLAKARLKLQSLFLKRESKNNRYG
ncbi:MAG: sigma-70 family RNA polymerase sigma factor [Bacteroidota bacterium]